MVEEFTVPEIQHFLALNAAMKKTQSFYEAYVKTFQDIHDQSSLRDSDSKTVPFSEEFITQYQLP